MCKGDGIQLIKEESVLTSLTFKWFDLMKIIFDVETYCLKLNFLFLNFFAVSECFVT